MTVATTYGPCEVSLPMKYRFYYTGIRVRNLTRSLAFYTKAFGMRVVNRGTMPHGGKYVQLEGAGSRQRLELNWYPPGNPVLRSLSEGRGDRPPGVRRGRRGESVPRTDPQGSEARRALGEGGRHGSLCQGSGRDLDRAARLIGPLGPRRESAPPTQNLRCALPMPSRCRSACVSRCVRSAGGIRSLCFVACNAVDGRSSSIPPCRTRSWPAIRSSDPIPSDGSGAAVRTQPTRRRGESHRPVEIHSKRSANSSTHFLGPPPEPPRTRSSGDPWATSRTTSAARSNGCRMRNLRTFGSRLCISQSLRVCTSSTECAARRS